MTEKLEIVAVIGGLLGVELDGIVLVVSGAKVNRLCSIVARIVQIGSFGCYSPDSCTKMARQSPGLGYRSHHACAGRAGTICHLNGRHKPRSVTVGGLSTTDYTDSTDVKMRMRMREQMAS